MRILQSRILFHEKNRRNIPMQKIAFHLNSLQQGGAERVVSNLANRFATRLVLAANVAKILKNGMSLLGMYSIEE